jgi:hypothetical protein
VITLHLHEYYIVKVQGGWPAGLVTPSLVFKSGSEHKRSILSHSIHSLWSVFRGSTGLKPKIGVKATLTTLLILIEVILFFKIEPNKAIPPVCN